MWLRTTADRLLNLDTQCRVAVCEHGRTWRVETRGRNAEVIGEYPTRNEARAVIDTIFLAIQSRLAFLDLTQPTLDAEPVDVREDCPF